MGGPRNDAAAVKRYLRRRIQDRMLDSNGLIEVAEFCKERAEQLEQESPLTQRLSR